MVRVAVIGFGFMGIVHCQNILKNKNMELLAIIDTDVNSVAKKINDPTGNFSTGETDVERMKKIPVYQSLKACLNKHQLDAVHICVHTNLHYEITKQALNTGLHVLLEKPFVLNTEEGEELIRLAKKKSRILMIAHVVRFMSPYKKLIELIRSKEFGELSFLSLSRFSGIPNWGQWTEKQKDFGSSGGALFDLVIHDIDFAAFILGLPDKINSSVLPGKLSPYDYLNASWEYSSKNVVVKIEGGNIFHSQFPFRAEFVAAFEKASISFSSSDADFIYVHNNEERKKLPANDLGDGYYNEIALFAESITRGMLPEQYSPESALETINLCYRHI